MFIGRRPDGSIYGAWTIRQPNDADHPGIEEVADDNPELIAFITRPPVPKRSLSDGELAAVLVAKQLLTQQDVTPKS